MLARHTQARTARGRRLAALLTWRLLVVALLSGGPAGLGLTFPSDKAALLAFKGALQDDEVVATTRRPPASCRNYYLGEADRSHMLAGPAGHLEQ